jgi:hypothetical protein
MPPLHSIVSARIAASLSLKSPVYGRYYNMTGAWITLLIGALAVYQWPASFDLTAGYGLGLVAGWSLWRAIPIGRVW